MHSPEFPRTSTPRRRCSTCSCRHRTERHDIKIDSPLTRRRKSHARQYCGLDVATNPCGIADSGTQAHADPTPQPWLIEAGLIAALKPSLNLADNGEHPFYPTLSAARKALQQAAR
jgi:hypothetical protein